MKRALCLIIAAIALFASASCKKSVPVERFGGLCVVLRSEGEDTAGKDLSIWNRDNSSSHTDESAPKTAKVNVLGKEFSGEYVYSSVFYPATHLSHVYKTEFGSFAVNANTGALDAFNASYEKTDETLTVDDVEAMAKEAAGHFINVDEYRLEVTEADPDNDRTSHVFRWTKYVGDVPTKDVFSIGFSVYGGGIASIGCSLVGTFDASEENVAAIGRLLEKDTESAVREKAAKRFAGENYELWIDDEVSAVCLPDGTPALMTFIEVSRNERDVANGETYYFPHTSAYDVFIFE